MNFIAPENYISYLSKQRTVELVTTLNDFFCEKLSEYLNLKKVRAPLIYSQSSGLSDNYRNIFPVVSFFADDISNDSLEVVRAVTKWKRQFIAELGCEAGEGIFAEAIGLRPNEALSNIHSVQVDQWDWEFVIEDEQYNLDFLKLTVSNIYNIFLECEKYVLKETSEIRSVLPQTIKFIHFKELAGKYPQLNQKQREHEAAKNFGAVFIIGIVGKSSSEDMDGDRSFDSDDWITPTENGFSGLNGDLIVWNPVLQQALELSSMGIRVNKEALAKQAKKLNCEDQLNAPWHQKLLNDELPLTIGGGIGLSRTIMFLLRKAHIGEVQSSVWSKEMEDLCKLAEIQLL